MNCPSFDNLHFPQEDVNTEVWVLKATVRKLLLISICNKICIIPRIFQMGFTVHAYGVRMCLPLGALFDNFGIGFSYN